MITGLKVWDRDGREISNITGRYPKFVGNVNITSMTAHTINYKAPQGTALIVVPVYLSRNDTFNKDLNTGAERDEGYSYTDSYNIWDVDIEYTSTGFIIKTNSTDNNTKNKPPIKVYWGYV